MKKLPIGIQTFSKFKTGNYLYIDKTREIYRLCAEGGKYNLLTRPRRFGKSLLVSTLKEIFLGNKELFQGLWIYDKIDWESFPVIHLDFLKIDCETPQKLKDSLKKFLAKTAGEYGVTLDEGRSYKESFVELIEKLSTQGRVVLLIDEYDRPIISHLDAGNKKTAKENRTVLKNFYSVIKGSDEHLKFVLLTGVSKFTRVSIFSDLNNLNDLTLDEKYSTLLGYTEEELLRYFPVGDKKKSEKIRKWYNGYSWDGKHFVYNPLSILLYFEKNSFANYWFSTGTPTFLIDAIKEKEFPVEDLEHTEADDSIFESFDIENMELTSLLFQTGYLTVKEKQVSDEGEETTYYLSYPNQEVRESFLKHLLKGFSRKDFVAGRKYLQKLKTALRKDKIDDFFAVIKSFFASIPYDIFIGNREGYYHTIIYLLLRLSGVSVFPEEETNIGRIDAVVETKNTIYILEFKIGTPEEAMNQIKEKKYYEPYLISGKTVILVGVGIDPSIRNITDYVSEPCD